MAELKEDKSLEKKIQSLVIRSTKVESEFEDLIVVPLFAIFAALIIGGLIMYATAVDVTTIVRSFRALLYGSVGSINAWSETLTAAIPLVLSGLGLGLGFRAGLFNIGAEGQLLMGGLAAVIVGFSLQGIPWVIHLPLVLILGFIIGSLYASIAGILKALTGAHEVISTIMLNLISFEFLHWVLRQAWIQREGRSDPISKSVLDTAQLPMLLEWLGPNYRLHSGLFVMLIAVFIIWWLLFRSKLGFAFRTLGENPEAANYSGMKTNFLIVLAMCLAGGLAGLGGAVQISGILERASPGFSAGIGFDAIAVALLGRSHPIGILFAGILFGGLEAGGRQMQIDAGVSIDLIGIIQALIIVFIAAPLLVKYIFPWGFRG